MRVAASGLRTARFWGFCFTFSWSALVQQWAGSAVGSGLIFPDAGREYRRWGVPLLCNASYLFAPLVGALIDRTGFVYAATLLILVVQATIALMWTGTAQWTSLAAVAALAGLAYPIQFSYLTLTFPPQCYPGLLTVVFIVQGTFGFIAWPVLSEIRPFGCADPCVAHFLLLLAPTPALFLWPLGMLCSSRRSAVTPAAASTPTAPSSFMATATNARLFGWEVLKDELPDETAGQPAADGATPGSKATRATELLSRARACTSTALYPPDDVTDDVSEVGTDLDTEVGSEVSVTSTAPLKKKKQAQPPPPRSRFGASSTSRSLVRSLPDDKLSRDTDKLDDGAVCTAAAGPKLGPARAPRGSSST